MWPTRHKASRRNSSARPLRQVGQVRPQVVSRWVPTLPRVTSYSPYNGSNPNGIDITSKSIITTSGDNPIEFATTMDVLVLPSNQNKVPPPPVSVQAVKPGRDGNVDAGMITVIPNNTLNNIAQAQNPPIAVSDVKLSVVNEAPTTGGGAKPTPAVTDQDLTKVKNDLRQQLQGEINAWQQQLSSTAAVGTPQTTDTLINAPKLNDIEPTE